MILIQRRRNADDDGIHVSQAGIVRSGLESPGAGLLNLAGQNTRNVSLTLGQRRNLALINIETRYSQLLLRKQQSKRQTDVAQTNNSDSRLTSFNPGF